MDDRRDMVKPQKLYKYKEDVSHDCPYLEGTLLVEIEVINIYILF